MFSNSAQHLQYSPRVTVQCSIYVQCNKTKQWYSFLLLTSLIRALATRQNSPSLQNGSMERRATEKARSKIYQLLFMWRIEQKELQKQRSARLRSSLQTRYQSEWKDSYGDQRAHGNQTSNIQCRKHLETSYGDWTDTANAHANYHHHHISIYHSEHYLAQARPKPCPACR